MALAILGMGTAVPPTSVTADEGALIARRLCCRTPDQESWVGHIYAGSGVEKRHLCLSPAVVADASQGHNHSGSTFVPRDVDDHCGPTTARRMETYRTEAPKIASQAAARALRQSQCPISDISHLVTVSCTGFHAPGVDIALIRELGLSPGVSRTHVGYMGCHGALNGLRVAQAFAEATQKARILLCAVELCSLHYHYGWDPQKLVANALFADGAAAIVAGPTSVVDSKSDWRLAATGSCVIPDSEDAMSWSMADHGFEMTLSKTVPGLIARHLKPWLASWLNGFQVKLEQVPSWAIHPGGPRILDAAAESLGLPATALHASRRVFAEFGNMSSPTVLFILETLRAQNAPRPCVALGFGPGLCVEAALLF